MLNESLLKKKTIFRRMNEELVESKKNLNYSWKWNESEKNYFLAIDLKNDKKENPNY
jgi:hypothetical protein